MISRETVDTFAKTTMDALQRDGVRTSGWERASGEHKRAYRNAVVEAFKAIGVKVEGDE